MHDLNRLVVNITNGTRAAHAFLVEGMAGEARSAFVTALAQGLECTAPDESGRPCGICPSCRQIAAGTSLDVVFMRKSTGTGKTARASYKVDDAAAFIEKLNMGAYGRFLIGIIDDADTLSEVIQNKLLKTLEEPNPDTILILTASNRDNLLSTVRSRCSDIRLSDYSDLSAFAGAESGAGSVQGIEAYSGLIMMLEDRRCRFCDFRQAMDKSIKSREEALQLLDLLEDDLRDKLISRDAYDQAAFSPQEIAAYVELAETARMDIRREMGHAKALKRLFLEIRQC